MPLRAALLAGLSAGLLLVSGFAHAARLHGRLLERGTRAPLAGILVQLASGEVISDADGRFVVEPLPAGPVRLRIVDDGFAPLEVQVIIAADAPTAMTWYLDPIALGDGTQVVGRVPRGAVRRTLSPTEIEAVAGTNGDPLAVVQALPGAARMPFGGNDLVLRGGGDTRAYLNGQWLPNAFHFGGLRSVVPGEMVDQLDVVPGSYGPAWGRGNGGVVTLTTRRPRSDRFGGRVRADLYDAAAFVEGPLTDRSGLALAARRSYIDAILPSVLGDDSPFRTAPRYWDLQLAHDWRRGDHQVSSLAFGSSDAMVLLFDAPPEDDPAVRGALENREGWLGAQSTWRAKFGDDTENSLMLGYLRYTGRTALGDALDIDVRLNVFSLRDQLEHRLSERVTLRGGLDVELAQGTFQVTAPTPPGEGDLLVPLSVQPLKRADVEPHYFWPAAWVEGELTLGAWQLRPALRLDAATEHDAIALQPRVAASYQATRSTTVQAAAGLYAQSPRPDQLDPDFGRPDLGYERGAQYSLGLTQAVRDWFSVGVTGFFKQITDRVTASADPAQTLANQGEGRIGGVEVLLRRPAGGRFSGWIAYTWSRSERKDRPDAAWRVFDLDQTHNLVVVGQARLGVDWALGGRFRLVSGNPYTPYRGATFDSDADAFVPIARGHNAARLPAFHQLDLRLDKHWRFDTWIFTTYLEVQNVYARANPEDLAYDYAYTRSRRVAGLPILPAFGLQGTF